jgi:hypothetical protein
MQIFVPGNFGRFVLFESKGGHAIMLMMIICIQDFFNILECTVCTSKPLGYTLSKISNYKEYLIEEIIFAAVINTHRIFLLRIDYE